MVGFIFCASIVTLVFSLAATLSFKIVFCDVGQGAATLLQMGTYQALIDTGPDARVLSCIGKHIPFFDHAIETVIISHNQKDHNGGLQALHIKYTIGHVYGPLPRPSFFRPDQYTEVSSPISLSYGKTAITISKASQSSNINDSANVVSIKTPHETIFLTSDINGVELKNILPPQTTILEVPHHGSKYGLYPDSLDLALPTLAVISVGKKNTYGHPSKEALAILKAKKIKIWRTDLQGELVVDLK